MHREQAGRQLPLAPDLNQSATPIDLVSTARGSGHQPAPYTTNSRKDTFTLADAMQWHLGYPSQRPRWPSICFAARYASFARSLGGPSPTLTASAVRIKKTSLHNVKEPRDRKQPPNDSPSPANTLSCRNSRKPQIKPYRQSNPRAPHPHDRGSAQWWARVDSNYRPYAYQAYALTT
jgi:hypothetical protein